ncbi:unnamed protein product [Orchesella dallaii]|uniref:Thioesterase domain-containing protein n=1 Tax=Orchesella dallaii TaxID=48710 RepID=A0ABP1S2Z9_9HEXA
MASRAGLELVQKMIAQRMNSGNLDRLLFNKVTVTSAGNGSLTAEMTVGKEHANVGGTLHGAMATFLVDSISTLTLATCPGVNNTGVSLNINMTFVRGAAVGQEIEIRSRADKAGGKLAFLSVDIVDKITGELLAKGSHTKYTAINKSETEIPR